MSPDRVPPDSGREMCKHRSPLNYDRTRYATCLLAKGHGGLHSDGAFEWTDRTMPSRKAASLDPGGER